VVATTGSNTVTIKIANSSSGTVTEANTRATTLRGLLSVDDLLEVGNSSIGTQLLKVTGLGSVSTNTTHAFFTVTTDSNYTLTTFGNEAVANVLTTASGYLKRYWEYAFNVDSAPGTSDYVTNFGNSSAVDEVHVVVADEDGKFTGIPGTVLEVYNGVSRATDAKLEDGSTNYVKTVINQSSKYIYYTTDRVSGASNTALNLTSLANNTPFNVSFIGGSDGNDEANVAIAELQAGFDLFKSAEDVDISLVLQGKARGGTNGEQLANYIIDNICEARKDCVAFISPDKPDVVLNVAADEAEDAVTFRNSLTSTSYGVLDSGYKYQYDKYNDIYRYVPLNGDVAGLCVRTDDTRDPWFSPAGFNRGIIKNVVKLAFNPRKAQRDLLYKNGVNPVVTFPGQGTLLFGDKTLLAKPSAFDRINVRRLFIVLEKAIATAAKFTLFEFNDEFTRAQFKNLVEPFLRDVQGRRGIYDFKVVCDETNNTPEVIDRNEFIGDIYIKPARSINFIQLNFVAVRTGVEFSEIVGQF
jgi:phage tail sheath protein FI